MTYCERLQQFLVENGAAALQQDAEAQQHLVDCNDCFDFLEALQQVDLTLAEMPEHDAPDALVQQTLAAITGAPEPATPAAPEAVEETKPSRLGRLLAWMRGVLGWLWGVVSFRWLRRRRERPEAEHPDVRPRWVRFLVNPNFWMPAAALSSLLILVTFMAVGTVYRSPSSDQGETDRFAKMVLERPTDSAARSPHREKKKTELSLDGVAGNSKRSKEQVDSGVAALGYVAEKGEQVMRRSRKTFDEGGGTLAGGGGGGTLGGMRTGDADDDVPQAFALRGTGMGDAAGAGGMGTRGTGSGGGGSSLRIGGRGEPAPGRWAGHAQATTAEREEVEEEVPLGALAKAPSAPPPPAKAERERTRDTEEDGRTSHRRRRGREKAADSALYRALSGAGAVSNVFGPGGLEHAKEKNGKGKDSAVDLDGEVSLRQPTTTRDATTVVIDKAEVDEAFNDLSEVATQARIVPSFENGQPTGFKLFSIEPGSLYDRLGLQNGDVVQRINGRQMNNPDKALETYQALKDAESVTIELRRRGQPLTLTLSSGEQAVTMLTPVRDFLAERDRTEGLRFKSSNGYWANTYVPGDPVMRLLETRLERTDRSMVGNLRLDRAARQYSQPFDAPTTSAFDVYLAADKAGIEGESRMLVQVGIKGTERRSRSRPAMNVGVVLDLTGTPDTEQQNAMRALVMALGEARDIGDRFTLVVAGRPGGVLVPSDSFRHGPLTVAMRSLWAGESSGQTLELTRAVERAIGIVVGEDDPTTPLGSSVVLLVTPSTLAANDVRALTEMAHESAVNGVPISTVGVGPDVTREQLDRIALAGQGNRRVLSAASETEGVVERELSSVSRVIARAVRLRIRLAPGVKLVDVIGSHRLGEERAEKVRRAEQSIDRRMSRNLGVQSDRGEDEDGVQMVIPSYYAGDSHVILLDVVAPGPGPIADVRVRYKDLVYLKNGVSRANLTVGRGELRAGPLEQNVLKNYIARKVADALERAGNHLGAGDVSGAQEQLTETSALLKGLMHELPALASDRDLRADLAMLGEYIGVLPNVASRNYVIASLRYAAFLKVLPRPVDDD